MTNNYIYIQGKRYNYYDTYKSYKEALKIGKWQKKKNKSKYYILITEGGFFTPKKQYKLYLTRVIKFGW